MAVDKMAEDSPKHAPPIQATANNGGGSDVNLGRSQGGLGASLVGGPDSRLEESSGGPDRGEIAARPGGNDADDSGSEVDIVDEGPDEADAL